ncbi:MAG: hypothetical protein AB7P21_04515 [Lautropia sp.]
MSIARTKHLAAMLIACGTGSAWSQTGLLPDGQTGQARAGSSPWAFQASGLITHFREARCTDCEHRSTVPGIGLQRDLRRSDASLLTYTFSGGLQSDSFGRSGGYVAAVASVPVATDAFLVKPGLGAFAFYRYMDEGSDRVVVPAVLPVLALENRRSGIGATLLAAPNFTYAGTERSGFVFLQFTFRLGRDG